MEYVVAISVTSGNKINLAYFGEILYILVRPSFAGDFQLGIDELFMD
jgi:hypothetical protein